jgi:hypothetical protein
MQLFSLFDKSNKAIPSLFFVGRILNIGLLLLILKASISLLAGLH